MLFSDVIAFIVVIAIIAIFPPIAMIRIMRSVPFNKQLAKTAQSVRARLEKYRHTPAKVVAFPSWYRVLPFVAVVGVLATVLVLPFIVLVFFGRLAPLFFPQALAILPAGAEYFVVAWTFALAVFAVLLAEPVLLRIFPRPMMFLSAQSLVNSPFTRALAEGVKNPQERLARIAGAFDLVAYGTEYLRARLVGFSLTLALGLVGLGIVLQGALVVSAQGFVFGHVLALDETWAWNDVESITITSRSAGDDGVEPAFLIVTQNETRDIWAIDSLTRVGDELIAVCNEARTRNIPILITSRATEIMRLPLTSADSARMLAACAKE